MKLLLLKHQVPMIKVFSKLFMSTIKKNKTKQNTDIKTVKTSIRPEIELIEAFHQWNGVGNKYSSTIAPHFFPQWSFPSLFEILKQTNFPLFKIMNQGCKLTVLSSIAQDHELVIKAQLESIVHEETKIRINQQVSISQNNQPLIDALIYSVIPIKKSLKKNEIKLDKNYEQAFEINFNQKMIREFGLISGDLNPIHMSSFMARMLGHKCSLAHGFSILSKVFELYETEYSKIKEIDIKFLRPLYLPNTVSLFIYPKEDLKQKFIVVSMDKKKIHAAGSVLS